MAGQSLTEREDVEQNQSSVEFTLLRAAEVGGDDITVKESVVLQKAGATSREITGKLSSTLGPPFSSRLRIDVVQTQGSKQNRVMNSIQMSKHI